jgi:hypothetical protein
MAMIDMEVLIPQDHLVRKIRAHIDFDFIYEEAEPYYSKTGRSSIDPVCLMKMLLIGYIYGARSERSLEEEITRNMAYRWFCGFELMGITGYYRLYRMPPGSCRGCANWDICRTTKGSIRISASPYYPAYYANRMRHETPAG